ncbi:MAG: hypothetical protein HRU36_03320 [Rickettsiales bacterium]|nr:hypothetical protein [Rickettsiales bacterium]
MVFTPLLYAENQSIKNQNESIFTQAENVFIKNGNSEEKITYPSGNSYIQNQGKKKQFVDRIAKYKKL